MNHRSSGNDETEGLLFCVFYSGTRNTKEGESLTPFKDREKQKAYMREYARKKRELFKKLLEKEKKTRNVKT